MKNDKQSRKWLLTLNNPLEKGFTHEHIREEMLNIKPCIYYCMSDEVGGKEKNHHTHIFVTCSSALRFSTIKNRFPIAHIDLAKGTCQQNRDYVFKEGKWENTTKNETKLPDTQFEWGDMPIERQGARNDLADLYDMIKSGLSNYEILEKNPDFILHFEKLDRARQMVVEEQYKNTFRELEVTYIWGKTGTGKTKSVMEKYGYENVFRVTGYTRGCFDSYKGQDVLILEEFRSGFPIGDLLNYLDGYPLELPCRYANKVACYTKVYLISNINLFEQYEKEFNNASETWDAFTRRINKVIVYTGTDEFTEYETTEYLSNSSKCNNYLPDTFRSMKADKSFSYLG